MADATIPDDARRTAMAAAAASPEIAFRRGMSRLSNAVIAAERVGWLNTVFERNPDVALLALDYLPGSVELSSVDFGPLSAHERRTVVETLQAFQRIYAIAGNVIPAMEIMGAGFRSASAIAMAGEAEFASQTGLPTAEPRRYQEAARLRATRFGAAGRVRGPGTKSPE